MWTSTVLYPSPSPCARIQTYFFPANIGLHAFLHLLGRDVFFMRGHPPEMPERILELARAVAVKLIHDGLAFFGAGGQRSLEKRRRVSSLSPALWASLLSIFQCSSW